MMSFLTALEVHETGYTNPRPHFKLCFFSLSSRGHWMRTIMWQWQVWI